MKHDMGVPLANQNLTVFVNVTALELITVLVMAHSERWQFYVIHSFLRMPFFIATCPHKEF